MVTAHKHKNKLAGLFEKANPQAVQLLTDMLQFNPYFRISAKDAMQHPYFDSVRHSYFERPCPIQIDQKIYNADAYDYQEFECTKYFVKEYKQMLLREKKKITKINQLFKKASKH